MPEKTIVYVMDPLCGWCFGFSPVVRELYDATKRRASWMVFSGGMVTGDRIAPIGELKSFLHQVLPRLQTTTGVIFGKPFLEGVLEEGTMSLSSLEPSRALQAVKALAPEKSLFYAHALQSALYTDGLDITRLGVLGDLAETLGVEGFEIEYMKTETLDNTLQEFKQVSSWGISGFPTLVGLEGEEGTVFSRGFAPFDRVFPGVDRWLERQA
jgi:putative protein-disulfide isomerase